MQRSPDNFGRDRQVVWSWTAIVLAVHAIILLTLVGLAVGYPGASEWISQAVQAEFVDRVAPPAAPAQIAQPVQEMRIVRTD